MQLTVADAHAARTELAARGVEVSEVMEFPWGSFVSFEYPDASSAAHNVCGHISYRLAGARSTRSSGLPCRVRSG